MLGAIVALCLATLVAGPADARGAFDVGMLAGTVSRDAATQSEARRARHGGGRTHGRRGGRMRALCAERFNDPASARAGRAVERMRRARGC